MPSALNKIKMLITRVLINRSSDSTKVPQVQISRFGLSSVAEVLQPQGLYFRTPVDAEGVALAPMGSSSGMVVVCAQDRDTWPAGGGIEDGTGGLHYLGAWRVFLDEDGDLHLGTKTGAAFVPRDDKLQDELDRIKGELDAVKADLTTIKAGITAAHAAVVPLDGGLVALAALVAAVAAVPTVSPASPGSTASANVKTT